MKNCQTYLIYKSSLSNAIYTIKTIHKSDPRVWNNQFKVYPSVFVKNWPNLNGGFHWLSEKSYQNSNTVAYFSKLQLFYSGTSNTPSGCFEFNTLQLKQIMENISVWEKKRLKFIQSFSGYSRNLGGKRCELMSTKVSLFTKMKTK